MISLINGVNWQKTHTILYANRFGYNRTKIIHEQGGTQLRREMQSVFVLNKRRDFLRNWT